MHSSFQAPFLSLNRPLRVAFIGQETFFQVCSLTDECPSIATTFIDYRKGFSIDELLQKVAVFQPDIAVIFRPEAFPKGTFHDRSFLTLGYLTEPLPRSSHSSHRDLKRRFDDLREVDRENIDLTISFDPQIAETAESVLPVWRSVPLPVADYLYQPVRSFADESKAVFIGRSTDWREHMLRAVKHDFDVLHLGFGVSGEDFTRVCHERSIALNIHNEPYPTFENRVFLHLAAGQLVISEPLHPAHGLEAGHDYLEVWNPEDLHHRITLLQNTPNLWHSIRVRGRQKAEQLRASKVWPRLLADFLHTMRNQ